MTERAHIRTAISNVAIVFGSGLRVVAATEPTARKIVDRSILLHEHALTRVRRFKSLKSS